MLTDIMYWALGPTAPRRRRCYSRFEADTTAAIETLEFRAALSMMPGNYADPDQQQQDPDLLEVDPGDKKKQEGTIYIRGLGALHVKITDKNGNITIKADTKGIKGTVTLTNVAPGGFEGQIKMHSKEVAIARPITLSFVNSNT